MSGEERRRLIVQTIQESAQPISGTALASMCKVSRQVIVQDIALLRASNYAIMSTPKGYVIKESSKVTEVVEVNHSDERIVEELNTIVDLGGRVLDVFVIHQVYGRIAAELNIKSRKDVSHFMVGLQSGVSKPLNNLTSGRHFHTIEADSIEDLELIKQELDKKNFFEMC